VSVRPRLAVFLSLLLYAATAHAERATVIPFQLPSSVGLHFEKHSFATIEGAFLPHFLILKSKKMPGDTENAHRWGLLFTPGVRFRITPDNTEPRSPSYLPRFDFQNLRLHDHGGHVNVWEWHLGAGHNSYREFSTNDVRGGLNFRHNLVNKEGLTTKDWSAGLEYQRQFATSANLKPTYSLNRVNATVSASWKNLPLPGRIKTEMSVSVASRWSFAPRVAWYPGLQTGLGIFAEFYRGEDRHNLGSAVTIPHSVQIGVEFEQDGFLKFKPR
jgi:hypothetical protein